ncbi:hypothetical protein OB919_13260 [Halobacteria archaeon AArc-curdl1]|uniref:Uncharacterized protein n=1 Tax=Natronosalvus hydrolyticus TaxID=2979988 RepID=A0AAP2Z9R8_9EURY|nr:hypothetical protein [Halobacteria archaeon AArc-curdl1]
MDGWNGRTPGFIEGETNPTLELYAGREYELTWINRMRSRVAAPATR